MQERELKMNTVLPIFILLCIGVVGYFICYKFIHTNILLIVSSAVLTTILWIVGVYLLLLITAPNELGPPLLKQILQIYITALLPAFTLSFLYKLKRT